jgi:hypothetical protein
MLYELIRSLSFLSSVLWVYTIYLVLQGMGHTTVYTVANSVYHSVANSVLDQLPCLSQCSKQCLLRPTTFIRLLNFRSNCYFHTVQLFCNTYCMLRMPLRMSRYQLECSGMNRCSCQYNCLRCSIIKYQVSIAFPFTRSHYTKYSDILEKC